MSLKNQLRLANAAGTRRRLRGRMICAKISKKYYYRDQIALVNNALDHLFTKMQELHGEDFRPEEWREFMQIRETVKAEVDQELSLLEKEGRDE